MDVAHSGLHETCVVGELTNSFAFASVASKGKVWAKQYPDLTSAVADVRRLGLIDRLFAVVAPQYIQQTRQHCVSPVASKVDHRKLTAAGFRQTDIKALV